MAFPHVLGLCMDVPGSRHLGILIGAAAGTLGIAQNVAEGLRFTLFDLPGPMLAAAVMYLVVSQWRRLGAPAAHVQRALRRAALWTALFFAVLETAFGVWWLSGGVIPRPVGYQVQTLGPLAVVSFAVCFLMVFLAGYVASLSILRGHRSHGA